MAKWPYVLLGVGGLTALVWRWTRKPRVITASYMQMVIVDEEGNEISRGPYRRVKPPTTYPVDGLSHVEPYVRRLLASKRRKADVSFYPPNRHGVSLRRWDGELSLHMIFRPAGGEGEMRARAFFAARGIEPVKDYLASGGRVPDSPQLIGWPVAAEDALETCLRALRELCDVGEHEGLDITYEAER